MHVRPIRPDDRDRLVAFHSRLSERTVYLRYFAPHPTLSERDLDRFTHVDHGDRVALVAQLGADLIGVGRYDRIDGGTDDAEVAFVVDDAHQGRGIGSVLLEHLAAGRPGARHPALRRRGARRERPDGAGLPGRRLHTRSYSYDAGVVAPELPDRADRRVPGGRRTSGSSAAESRSIERLLTPRSVAVVGASTDPAQGRARRVRQPAGVRLRRGRSTRCTRRPGTSAASGPTRACWTSRTTWTWPWSRCRPPRSPGWSRSARRKRVRGLVVVSGGFGERGAGRPGAGAGAGHRGARAGHAGGRPELPRRGQRRPRGPAQRHARAAAARPRPGRLLLPVRRARRRDPGRGGAPGARPVHLRLGRQPGRRQRQRPAPVLGDRPGHRRGPALPGELRQPAQVRPAGPAGGPDQAGGRGEDRPVRGGTGAGGTLGAGAGGAGAGAVRGGPG